MSPRGLRSRLGKGKAILSPSESSLRGHLTFKSTVQKDLYSEISTKSIVPCKCVHYPTLDELGIRDKFDAMVDGIGWRSYFQINCPAFIELTREFYTTFSFTRPEGFTLDSPNVVRYRLMGKEFKQSMTEFNIALGFITTESACSTWYQSSRYDYGEDFSPYALWKTMSSDPQAYNPSQSKSSYLLELVWQYVHRFLAFTYSGRKGSSITCTKAELFFLWAMINNVKVNLGCWLAK